MEPLISCLMVTRPGLPRLGHVKRAIRQYLGQTYPRTELVLTLDAGSEEDKAVLEEHVASLGRADVRVARAPGQPTLGRLRNFALAQARGDLLAIWDDDDIHHHERLAEQARAVRESGALGTFLTEALHLFMQRGELYWTNYRNTAQKCLPSAALVRREARARYPEEGPESLRGEDTAFCLRLMAEGPVHFMDDAAHLYTYVNHGTNTSGDSHHDMLARTLSVSRGRVLRREAQIRDSLARAALGLPQVTVKGNNGIAFVWQADDLAGAPVTPAAAGAGTTARPSSE